MFNFYIWAIHLEIGPLFDLSQNTFCSLPARYLKYFVCRACAAAAVRERARTPPDCPSSRGARSPRRQGRCASPRSLRISRPLQC